MDFVLPPILPVVTICDALRGLVAFFSQPYPLQLIDFSIQYQAPTHCTLPQLKQIPGKSN